MRNVALIVRFGKGKEVKYIGALDGKAIIQAIGDNALKECGMVALMATALAKAETAISLSNFHISRK